MTIRITDRLTKIMLCQVIPGSEKEVISHFRKIQTPHVLLSFGDFDLVGVSTGSVPQVEKDETFGQLGLHLRDYQEVLCFGWEALTGEFEKWTDYPAWAISFFKMKPGVATDPRLLIEHAVVKFLWQTYRNKKQVKAFAMGNIGWTEVVVFWASDSFHKIIREVIQIRRLSWGILNDPRVSKMGKEKVAVFASSYTIPCVKLTDLQAIDWSKDPNFQKVDDEVEAAVLIKCVSENNDYVIHELDSRIPDFGGLVTPTTVFGQHDLRLDPKNGTIAVNRLAEIIRAARGIDGVQLTRTVLSLPNDVIIDVEAAPVSVKRTARRHLPDYRNKFFGLLSELDRLEERLDNDFLRIYPQLAQVLSRFNVAQSNPDFAGLFDDMQSFVDHVFVTLGYFLYDEDPYFVWVSPTTRKRFESFSHVSRMFQIGFEQRLNGALIGPLNSSRTFTGLRAYGVQRIIQAANAVAHYCLSQVSGDNDSPFQWVGFTVFGYPREMLRLSYGVLNLPRANLMKPDRWWVISHAMGHEFFELASFDHNPVCKNIINVLTEHVFQQERHVNRRDSHGRARHLVEELIADVFTFHIAFDAKWDGYADSIWSHLDQRFQGRPLTTDFREHVVRSVFIYFYFSEMQGALDGGQTLANAIESGRKTEGYLFGLPRDQEDVRSESKENMVRNAINQRISQHGDLESLIANVIREQIAIRAPRCATLFEQLTPREVADFYGVVEPLRWFAGAFVDVHLAANPLRHSKRNVKGLAKRLRQGEIIYDVPPTALLAAAVECAKGDISTETPWAIACILSLSEWGLGFLWSDV